VKAQPRGVGRKYIADATRRQVTAAAASPRRGAGGHRQVDRRGMDLGQGSARSVSSLAAALATIPPRPLPLTPGCVKCQKGKNFALAL